MLRDFVDRRPTTRYFFSSRRTRNHKRRKNFYQFRWSEDKLSQELEFIFEGFLEGIVAPTGATNVIPAFDFLEKEANLEGDRKLQREINQEF